MSLLNIISIVFLFFTFYLLLKKKSYGKAFLYFGGLTYIFVIIYTFIPYIDVNYKSVALFIYFSLLLILFGLLCGSIAFLFKKDNKFSQIISIVSSALLMFLLFNKHGLLSYIYVPVLMYIVQFKFNENFNFTDNIIN